MSGFNIKPHLYGISIVIDLIVCVAAITFIVSSLSRLTNNHLYDNRPIIDYPYFTNIDNTVSDTTFNEKEVIRELWKNQKYLDSLRSDLMADIRQETNNTIEKVTSELNFWVAILALLGVFVPIALTYKGERDFKDKFREQTDFLGQQIEARVTDQISRMNDVRDSLDCRIELFDSTLCRIENLENDIDLEMCISSIASIRNNRLLEHSHDLREAYINLAIRPLRQFVVIFQAKLSDDNILSNEQERWSLIKMCFQIYEILRNMTYDHSGPSRPRFLYQGEESLKILIRELMNEFPSIENIRNQMNIVAANIAMIIRRVRESEAMS